MAKSWASKIIGMGGKYDPGAPREMPYYHWRQWAPLAPNGAPQLIDYREPSTGKTYKANKNRDESARRPDGRPMLLSEVQSMNFLRVCPNAEDIQLFIEQVDSRSTVRLFAQDIVALRRQQEEERTQIPIAKRRRHRLG